MRGLSQHWRAQTAPSSLWAEVEDYVATIGDRVNWQAEARLLDGRVLGCAFSALAGGATLAAFRPGPPADLNLPKLAEAEARQTA